MSNLLAELGAGLGAIAGAIAVPLTGGASLPLVGTSLGALGSAVAGASAGSALGGTAGNLAGMVAGGKQPAGKIPPISTGSAMSRRAQSLAGPDSITTDSLQSQNKVLGDSLAALEDQPAEVQQQFGPTLAKAFTLTTPKGPKGQAGVIS